ncbi:uncharacterized protein LOC116844660 isoform X2 [Odontomachus brunneus]|uniref:uncharacterized protein LOC116844660 isoform X2 n=1 Tax=Odontomachus brunneus TaxID=486640 RepID=UPI0013F23254|nr:uncharacterized protein LOC116844660 isoform X2 [Odontomachus brunneus]
MELRMFWFIVMCILCVCRDAIGESIFTTAFTSINNASQFNDRTKDAQIERLIQMQTRPIETTRKDDKFDLSVKTKTLSGFKNVTCSRYCIEQLGTGKNPFEDINLFWSFAGSKNEADHFFLRKNPKLKISRHVNKSLTDLDNSCQIYLYLDCDIINMKTSPLNQHENTDSNLEINHQSVETLQKLFSRSDSEFLQKKTLAHNTNLSGYTEIKFHIDASVMKIIINIRGNLTRAALAIPTIPRNRTMRRPGITMSLARTYDMKGVAIDARNPPPGGYLMKLTGVENSKYNFDVTGYFGTSERNNTRNEIIDVKFTSGKDYTSQNEATAMTTFFEKHNEFDKMKKDIHEDMANSQINSTFEIRPDVSKKPKFVYERSADIMDAQANTDAAITDDLPDTSPSSLEAIVMKDIINDSALSNNSLVNYGDVGIPQNASNKAMFNGRMLALPGRQEQKIQTRSSEIVSLNEDIDMNVKPFLSNNVTIKTIKNQELSTRLAENKEDIFRKEKILIEVNPESNLIAIPGRIHTIFFDLTNNCVLTVRYAVRATSSSFRINNIRPMYVYLYPGQTSYVAVDIIVPTGIRQDTVNTLTLFVDGTEISEKTVYVYIQNPYTKIIDNVRPTIEYSFNSNCAGNLNKDRCDKTFWSADVTIQDPDSGLKSVTSTPNRIYPRSEFISGTKNSVTFYYLSTCCYTTATVTAIDSLNNEYSRKIDVTEWDNLSQGEIAAVVVGALFLLLLLILLIIAIVYCVRKKNSHDLPYTQRYGSRQPPRSERTSF